MPQVPREAFFSCSICGLLSSWAAWPVALSPLICGLSSGLGIEPTPLHWQVDSQPLDPQGNPQPSFCNTLQRLMILRSIGEPLGKVTFNNG